MRYTALAGRILFSIIFILAGYQHFTAPEIEAGVQHGLPFAKVLVPAAGVIAGLGGLSVLLGYHARIGAALIVVFLVPVTLVMHAFWRETNQAAAQLQLVMFLKNLSMLGGALIVTYFGSGPLSLGARTPTSEPYTEHRHAA
jgi:putative oxidoreductase